MDIASVGSLCAGIVTTYFIKMYLTRVKKFDLKGLSAVLLMLFGGSTLSFIKMDPKAYWFYPIGLFLGLVLYIILAMALGGKANICAYRADK